MTFEELNKRRLINQQIANTNFSQAEDLVHWMGAIQAQDYAMAKWAIGCRLISSNDQIVEEAMNSGKIIRTHVLRPTWHFVSAKDIHWMLELTAPRIKPMSKAMHRLLELNQIVFNKSYDIIIQELKGGRHIVREELIKKLNQHGIITNENRASHIFLNAELDGLICSGTIIDKKQSYTLLEEWVSKTTKFNKDESLANLAFRYFNSHSPASIHDFAWWSGLSLSEARNAIQLIKSELTQTKIGSVDYYLVYKEEENDLSDKNVFLLPAFDEYLISYKDRRSSISIDFQKYAFTNNGIFKPIIVFNGEVTGIWKRTIKNNRIIIETNYFKKHNKHLKQLIEKEANRYAMFLQMQVELIHGE